MGKGKGRGKGEHGKGERGNRAQLDESICLLGKSSKLLEKNEGEQEAKRKRAYS